MEIVAQLAISLDGRTEAAGPPAMFGGPADRARMIQRRARADLVLVGGRTFCAWPLPPTLRRDWWPAAPAAPPPHTVVVTQQNCLNPRPLPQRFGINGATISFFGPTGFVVPESFQSFAESTPVEGDPLDAALRAARARGARRALVEGGWGLIRALLQRGALDALHLSLCPLLLGAGRGVEPSAAPGLAPDLGLEPGLGLRLLRAEEAEGLVFLHFVPERRAGPATLAADRAPGPDPAPRPPPPTTAANRGG